MVSLSTWFRYIAHKLEYSVSISYKSYKIGQITEKEVGDSVWKHFFQGKLTTILHWNKGEEMAPILSQQGGTLLVRKLPTPDPTRVFVGDVVVLKDPENSSSLLVRRLAAIEGGSVFFGPELVMNRVIRCISDEKARPVQASSRLKILPACGTLPSQEARDSRTFGPVPLTDILGRVMYCLRTAVDHGPVQNSHFGVQKDTPVLAVELDVNEMARNHKA